MSQLACFFSFPLQAAKCQQQLADLERKKADAQKSAAAAAADFQQARCRRRVVVFHRLAWQTWKCTTHAGFAQ